MNDSSSLRALLGTVDRTLADHGVDPATVPDEDKIIIAAQCVETEDVREKIALKILPEDLYAQLFGTASCSTRSPLRQDEPVLRLSCELSRRGDLAG